MKEEIYSVLQKYWGKYTFPTVQHTSSSFVSNRIPWHRGLFYVVKILIIVRLSLSHTWQIFHFTDLLINSKFTYTLTNVILYRPVLIYSYLELVFAIFYQIFIFLPNDSCSPWLEAIETNFSKCFIYGTNQAIFAKIIHQQLKSATQYSVLHKTTIWLAS